MLKFPEPPPNKNTWPWIKTKNADDISSNQKNNFPKISIITPSYNQGNFLEETIRSILLQGYPNLEYIIIDGGSTDDSVEIIKKYEPWLTYWVSEKDLGQSHAINKGLKIVTGEIINWINSDDYLEEDSLFLIASEKIKNPDIHAFQFSLFNEIDGVKRLFNNWNNVNDEVQCFSDPIITQPSTFYTSLAVSKMGPLNTQLHYVFDYEWWLKFLFLLGIHKVKVLSTPVATYRIHERTKSSQVWTKFEDEIASLIYILAKRFHEDEYSNLLKKSFIIDQKLIFDVNVNDQYDYLIDRMAAMYLLKTHSRIFSRTQFDVGKQLVKILEEKDYQLSYLEELWHAMLVEETRLPSWFWYKVKRKFNHLFNILFS